MKHQLHILLILFASYVLAFMLTGCAVTPPDSAICVEVDIARARCTHVMSGENFTIDNTHLYAGKTYWEMRPEMLLIPAQSWVEIKEFILKICATTHQCGAVKTWDQTVSTLQDELDSKAVGAP